MRLPMPPNDYENLLRDLMKRPDGPERFIQLVTRKLDPAPAGKYRHWDILRHLAPPEGLTSEEWWAGIKLVRHQLYKDLPLRDKTGTLFRWAPVDPALSMLHEIDQQASGAIQGSTPVTDSQTRDTYLIRSLFEEAITSSQLEGASTTREAAKEMLQRGREPQDRGERMIFNNYQAMQFIRSISRQQITPSMVFELHRILTQGTLDDASAAGRFRTSGEEINVYDEVGTVLHVPPRAEELGERLDRLCAFANGSLDEAKQGEPFIHPVVRAILLHFGLAYDHPFVDGNGRTARALFYWGMAAQGYWLIEYTSISRIIKAAPGKYNRAYLYTETDDNDATYFILNQLGVIVRAIRELHGYLERKSQELRATKRLLQDSAVLHATLNHRQLALVHHAMRNAGFVYSIESHRRSHNVSYQTARTDLLALSDLTLLEKKKKGKLFVFFSPPDLTERLKRVTDRTIQS